MDRYMIPLKANKEATIDMEFRTTRIRTRVNEPNKIFIENILLNGVEQMLCSVDAYQWSGELAGKLYVEFLERYGLKGKSSRQIDDYLDENDLTPPDPGAVMLPTVVKGTKILVKASADCDLILCGYGRRA